MPKDVAGDTLYTLEEVAEALGLPGSTLRLYARDGRIKARKIGKAWHVTEAALKAFLQSEKSYEGDTPRNLPSASGAAIPGPSESELQMARERGHLQTRPEAEYAISAAPRHLATIGQIDVG